MRTIVHISDLHFGRVNPAILPPLTAKIIELAPDVLVVTGDLTQRARPAEFATAALFLANLPFPKVVVPGNHDISLTNPFQRLLRPLARFRAHIHREVEPSYFDGQVAILGANTARAWLISNGHLSLSQLRSLRVALADHGPNVFKIIATHHPLAVPPKAPAKARARGADRALAALATSGADLLLSGHLHLHHADGAGGVSPSGPLLAVSAGTATSTRLRDEPNSFNALRVDKGHIEVERLDWNKEALCFATTSRRFFLNTPSGWQGASS